MASQRVRVHGISCSIKYDIENPLFWMRKVVKEGIRHQGYLMLIYKEVSGMFDLSSDRKKASVCPGQR